MSTSDALAAMLAYYRDLGFKDVYQQTAAPAQPQPQPQAQPVAPVIVQAPKPVAAPAPPPAPIPLVTPALAPVPVPKPPQEPTSLFAPIELPSILPPDDTLEKIRADIGECTRCRLHSTRHNIVFGVGDPNTKLVFVGEGPGQDEDLQGIPFVGRAGQLLTAMIENTAQKEGIPLKRADVYICNVVKCRPPDNRTPEPDEMEICGQFLFRQLAAINPKAICVLGGTASKALLARKEGVTKMRGNWYKWRDIPVMVTYHPSFLLRAYNQDAKREAWEDLKKLFHFVYD